MDVIHLTANLQLYTTEKGGRKRPIFSRYRPNHVFEYENGQMKDAYMGTIIFDHTEKIYPGEAGTIQVKFPSEQNIHHFMEIGRTWWIHEGNHKMGEATIINIIHDPN